ncbi:MAG: hypothetical protein SFU83_23600 [Meiothermus sp.]|nr:hypothetical protein [Meiothermus sp.]
MKRTLKEISAQIAKALAPKLEVLKTGPGRPVNVYVEHDESCPLARPGLDLCTCDPYIHVGLQRWRLSDLQGGKGLRA